MTKEEFARNFEILDASVPKHAKINKKIELDIYMENLKDLSGESFSKAIAYILLNQKTFYQFPTIREIRELCYKYDSKAALFKKAFEKVTVDALVYEYIPENYNSFIKEAINDIGGWKFLKAINSYEDKKEIEYKFVTILLKRG